MDERGKSNKQDAPAAASANKIAKKNSTFSHDMRFVVTRNTRNAWMDDLYETTPENGSLPIFH